MQINKKENYIMYDYNFWDDRELEEYFCNGNHPCSGCADFKDDECISNGACARIEKSDNKN